MRATALAALVGAATVSALAGTGSAEARYEGPWCLHYSIGTDAIVSRCDMRSYEMCRDEMMGLSSHFCVQNPHYVPPGKTRSERKARQRDRR